MIDLMTAAPGITFIIILENLAALEQPISPSHPLSTWPTGCCCGIHKLVKISAS
jgi:hypothetical protein